MSDKEQSIEEQFMADTTLEQNPTTPFSEGTPPPVPEKPVAAGTKIIALSDPELLPDQTVNFLELIELRATVRQYSDTPLTF